jgi:cobalamin biosynthesis Mg chelatase CobN
VVVKVPEETEHDAAKAAEKLREAEKAEPASDVGRTPSPGEPIDIPYPNTGMASDTSSGSKAVKTEGGDSMPKGSTFQQSTGDEPGTSGSNVNNAVDTVKTTKVMGVPVWIWVVSAIALVAIAIIWLATLNAPQLIEPVEQQKICLITALS